MVASAPTIKVSEVITNVLREFGDESGAQIRDADIIRWINQGQREIVSRNPFNKKVGTINSAVGQASYDLPDDVFSIESIGYDTNIFLRNIGWDQARTELSGNSARQGIPDLWYEYGNTVYFWPIPNSVKTITMYYVASPAPVNSPGNTLSIPDRYYNALLQYCMVQAYSLDEDWTAQQTKQSEFENSMKNLTNVENVTYGAPPIWCDPDFEPGGLFA